MKIKRDEFCGYLFVICMMIFYSIDQWKEYWDGIMYFGILAGVAGIVFSIKMRLKTFLVYMAFCIIPIISFVHAHDTRILVMVIAMLCGIRLDARRVLSVMFYTKLFCFMIVMIAGGYGHINGAAIHGGMLIMLYICMHREMKLYQIFVVLFSYALLALYTQSGSFIVCAGLGIALVCLFKITGWREILENKVVEFIYPICLLFNYFFAAGVGETSIPYIGRWLPRVINNIYVKLVVFLDRVMNSRLTLTKYSWNRFSFSFWGGNVDYSLLDLGVGGYFNLDSGLMWLVQGGGIFLTVGFMVLSVILMRYLMKNQYDNYIIVAVVIALWSVNEDVLLGFGTNFLIIFMGKAVWDYGMERSGRRNEHT